MTTIMLTVILIVVVIVMITTMIVLWFLLWLWLMITTLIVNAILIAVAIKVIDSNLWFWCGCDRYDCYYDLKHDFDCGYDFNDDHDWHYHCHLSPDDWNSHKKMWSAYPSFQILRLPHDSTYKSQTPKAKKANLKTRGKREMVKKKSLSSEISTQNQKVPTTGIEPATSWLEVRRSTNWAKQAGEVVREKKEQKSNLILSNNISKWPSKSKEVERNN